MQNNVFLCSSVHSWNGTRLFYKTAMSLAKNNFKVDLCAVSADGKVPEQENLAVCKLKKRSRFKRPINWMIILKRAYKSEADFFHFNDPELLLIAALLRRKKKHKIFIYDMYENFPKAIETKSWIYAFLRKPLSKIIRYIEKYLLKKMDAVIFAEKSYKEDYSFLKCLQIDIYNYPTFVPKQNMPKEQNKLIYVGDITKERGLFEMLSVVKELKEHYSREVRLVLIGSLSDKNLKEMDSFLINHGITTNVNWLGVLPYDSIWKELNSSSIGLCLLHPLPNYIHSLATKLFEYMAAELPIIASDFSDWKQLIETSQTGVVTDPFDIKKVSHQVNKLLNDRSTQKLFSENGRKAYSTKFNWEMEETKLINFYNNLKSEDI